MIWAVWPVISLRGAGFRLIGEQGLGLKFQSDDPLESLRAIIDLVGLSNLERCTVVGDSLQVAVHLSASATVGSGKVTRVEMCDFWKFDESGGVALAQFADTALLQSLPS